MTRLAAALAVLLAARTAAASRHCHEVSHVLGHRRCGGFGARWASSWMSGLQIGFMSSTFEAVHFTIPTHAHVDSVETAGGAPIGERSTLVADPTVTLYGFRSGIHWRGEWLVLSLELAGDFGSGPTVLSQADGRAVASQPPISALQTGLTIGVHRRYGRWDLVAAVYGGLRDTMYGVELPARVVSCVQGKACNDALVTETSWIVEPRARVDYWLSRTVTLGVTYGHDVVGGGDLVAATIGLHVTPFDGY